MATTTHYRVGTGGRVIAATRTRTNRPTPPPPPVDVQRVHPRILSAALRLAGGDASRLVFISTTQVDVLPAAR